MAGIDPARDIERDVLDKHHLRFGLLRRNQWTATEALFQCFTLLIRELRADKIRHPTKNAKFQIVNAGLRGLAHCLRWIKDCCPTALHLPPPDVKELADEAYELLRWSAEYDPVWNQHSSKSKCSPIADVDEVNRTVTFAPVWTQDPRFFCTQLESKKIDDSRLSIHRPDDQLAALSSNWFESRRLVGRRLVFDDAAIGRSGAIDLATAWLRQICMPELDDGAQLIGCTAGELRRVLATLYTYSLFVVKLEDYFDENSFKGADLPTRIWGTSSEIAWRIHALSGVPIDCVRGIVSTLTFDEKHPHVTLAQQPFVDTGDGRLLFVPRISQFLDLPRMYVGATNSTPEGRKLYESLINRIEDTGVSNIAEEIRSLLPPRYSLVDRRKFRVGRKKLITPDLVLVSPDRTVVLTLDIKYATPPFGPLQVRRDVEEIAKWKERMQEYVTYFRNDPAILSQHFDGTFPADVNVRGLILLRWPLPVPAEFTDAVDAVDWPSLREYMKNESSISIPGLMKWVRLRPDILMPPVAWDVRELVVGDWTYRYEIISAMSPKKLHEFTKQLAYRLWEERGRPLWEHLHDWDNAVGSIQRNPYIAVDRGAR